MANKPRSSKSKSSNPSGKGTGGPRASIGDVQKAARPRTINPEIVEPEIVGAGLGDNATDEGPGSLDDLKEQFESLGDIEVDPDREIESLAPYADGRTPGPGRVNSSSLAHTTKRSSGDAITPEIVDPPENSDGASSSKALAASDPVSVYLAEIRKYPLLTREQEHELAVRYREAGDAKAAEILVTSNLRFVVKVAAEYSRFGAKLIDLIQEGNVGLMHAVKEFNPYKGVRLITYAVWWIRGYIQEYLMRQYSLVRIGTTQNQRKLFYRLQKERDALLQAGQEPTTALLAGRLGVSEDDVETMSQRLAGRDVSLNQPIDNSGQSAASMLDFEASEGPLADEAIALSEQIAVLNENIEKIRTDLNPKETYILENRLLADEPLTLQEIGDHFGVTREAVRQLEARLIGKIRAAVTASLAAKPDDLS